MVRKAISKHIGGSKEALTVKKKKKVNLEDFKNKGGTKIIDEIKWKMGGDTLDMLKSFSRLS